MKKPFAYMWTTSSGRLNLVFTQDQIDSVPCSGPADDQIGILRPLVARQFENLPLLRSQDAGNAIT